MCLSIQWAIIFRIHSAIGKIIFSNQTAVGYDFHSMHQITVLILHVAGPEIVISLEMIPSYLPITLQAEGFVAKALLQHPQSIGNRCNTGVCKERIQPQNLRIQKSNILRQCLNVLCRKHICEYKFRLYTDITKHLCTINLCIFYAAGGPANTMIKVIDHTCSYSLFHIWKDSIYLWQNHAKFSILINRHAA